MKAITEIDQLPARLGVNPPDLNPVIAKFPMRITPHYLALIRTTDDPLAKQVIPDPREIQDAAANPDPLNEEAQSPAPQIIHRYPHRVILLVSNQCPLYCRFCMRKRRIDNRAQVSSGAIGEGLAYIDRNPQINEVILSGGDPLMLADRKLIRILKNLRRISHVRILRLHTRIPCTWPQRVTPALAKALSAFHPLFVNIHFNHPDEITPPAEHACSLLADAGIPLGSQTVLLRGINDHAETLRRLFHRLLENRVRPYYLHMLDRVPGTRHFRVPLETALALMGKLRGIVSGIAMPHFMVDLPGGGGKVELLPDACVSKNKSNWAIRNFEGRNFAYPLE